LNDHAKIARQASEPRFRNLLSVAPFANKRRISSSRTKIEETPMNRPMFSIVAASLLVGSVGIAAAQTTTTTTTSNWSADEGAAMRSYSTTRHYQSFNDPAMHPSVGMTLPNSVTVYPLPDTMKMPSAERYSYSIINNQPVVVERTTRKVVHTWD
jgi:hypothetical protein